MKRTYLTIVSVIVLFSACSDAEQISFTDTILEDFNEQLEGVIPSTQYWETAVRLTVKVIADANETVEVEAHSIGQAIYTIYDKTDAQGTKTVTLTLPQGMGNNIAVTATSSTRKLAKTIILDGQLTQNLEFNFLGNNTKETRAATNEKLYGNSILGGCYYNDIKREVWNNVMELVSKESVDASTRNEIVNYELVSNGRFEITFITGFGASMDPHVIGYYYHSPNTYGDTKLVDIAEVQVYDYLDGMAKTQYMLNDAYQAHNAYLAPYVWHDSNFDMHDDPGDAKQQPNVERRNDDAYNSILVWQRMGDMISRIRGLTFVVDVPIGMHLGFYLRLDEERSIEQFNHIVKLGMPDNIFPYTFTGYNFSAQAFNFSSTGKKKHRSWIHEFEEFTFLGMENIFNGGDLDCNDIVFGMTATDMDMILPDVTNPTIDATEEIEIRNLPWTIAYEDIFRGSDFDFNDAVIQIAPDYDNNTCKVKAMACGTEAKMYLHYDGPDGDINLGELHELLSGKKDYVGIINTQSGTATTAFKEIATVAWPKEYTIANDAQRFYIEVKRGDCTDCSDIITLPTQPGEMPKAILVAGEWQWPKEEVKITEAYPYFKRWATSVTNTLYWYWHTIPNSDKCVEY